MLASDIFAGPIIRRAQPDMVAIWLATRKKYLLSFRVRPVGSKLWTGQDAAHKSSIEVLRNLHVYLHVVTPIEGSFPTNKLLEYSIAIMDPESEDEDHSFFEKIVEEDGLSYDGFKLPTFYLQKPGNKLCALYASCRKIHGQEQSNDDALRYGDDLVAEEVEKLDRRPAVLLLTGDQIYADDVPNEAFDEISRLSVELEDGTVEKLAHGRRLPGKGDRQEFVARHAKFTSGSAANHLITLAEYAAMYGLAWNARNWERRKFPVEVRGYVRALPQVRRLLANTPTYMIFDDHEVTDDWNLSLKWKQTVWKQAQGERIVSHALYCFWLFQGWGNDPAQYKDRYQEIQDLDPNYQPDDKFPSDYDTLWWGFGSWEFFTPTVPMIYFLDTRSQRGGRTGYDSDIDPPAYLKSVESWKKTYGRLRAVLARQSSDLPVVLVAPAPVFGFSLIEDLQGFAPVLVGPYPTDWELWSHNMRHLLVFLKLCADRDVVLLSGDVHFAYTSTVKFSMYDDYRNRRVLQQFPMKGAKRITGNEATYEVLYAARFIQLTSSGAKNSHPTYMKLEDLSAWSGDHDSIFINQDGKAYKGHYKDGELQLLVESEPTVPGPRYQSSKMSEFKPHCSLFQRMNDVYNSELLSRHNIGYLQIHGRKVKNKFLLRGGAANSRTWDFANSRYWEPS